MFHWLDKLPETSYLRSFIKTIAGYADRLANIMYRFLKVSKL